MKDHAGNELVQVPKALPIQCAFCKKVLEDGRYEWWRSTRDNVRGPFMDGSSIWVYCSLECGQKHEEAETVTKIASMIGSMSPEGRGALAEALKKAGVAL